MNTSAISVFDIDRKLMSTGSCEVARVFYVTQKAQNL